MQLLISPKQVLVDLQKCDLIQFLKDREGMSLTSTSLEQLTDFSLGRLGHSKVDDEVELAEAWSIQARHHEIHLVKLVPWEMVLPSELIVVQLLLDEVGDKMQHRRKLLLWILDLFQRLLSFIELGCQSGIFLPLLEGIPAAASAASSSTSSSATTATSLLVAAVSLCSLALLKLPSPVDEGHRVLWPKIKAKIDAFGILDGVGVRTTTLAASASTATITSTSSASS